MKDNIIRAAVTVFVAIVVVTDRSLDDVQQEILDSMDVVR